MPLTPSEQVKRDALLLHKPLVHSKVTRFEESLAAGRSIAIIQLQYDYRCNFSCSHCSIIDFRRRPSTQRSLTPTDVRSLCDQADAYGLAHLDLTGGEPLAFPDLKEVIEAIDPQRFYLQVDTNGLLMGPDVARWLKSIGVDKIQLSLDSLDESAHDEFRRHRGSFQAALRAIDAIQAAGLALQLATVVTHQRLYSDEFRRFLDFAKSRSIYVSVCWPKFVGQWAGRYEGMVTRSDIDYFHTTLVPHYPTYDHLTPSYGLDLGCLAVKRMIAVTKWGDVLPCPWMYFSLGNVLDTPLSSILAKGMHYFGDRHPLCRVSEDMEFIKAYVEPTYCIDCIPTIEEVMSK